jgi:hypothetical protein
MITRKKKKLLLAYTSIKVPNGLIDIFSMLVDSRFTWTLLKVKRIRGSEKLYLGYCSFKLLRAYLKLIG